MKTRIKLRILKAVKKRYTKSVLRGVNGGLCREAMVIVAGARGIPAYFNWFIGLLTSTTGKPAVPNYCWARADTKSRIQWLDQQIAIHREQLASECWGWMKRMVKFNPNRV